MLIAGDDTILQKVRERAYAIWEREGRPHGRDKEHWLIAEKEVVPVPLAAKPAKKVAKKAANGAAKTAPKARVSSAAAKVTPKTTRRKASTAKSK